MDAIASVFAIDVLSYAVMSNHLHQILRNRPDVCAAWSDQEVAIRWLRVFPGRRLEEHLAEPTENDVKTLCQDKERLKLVRQRLSDISWFMRALAEPIARMANKQDDCTGRFWEGRFKCQRIVDEAGLLACSLYVDLNPVRAAIAQGIEDSPHTSAYDRLAGQRGKQIPSAAFDLKPVKTEEAGKKLRQTPVDELRRQKKSKRRSPTGRKVRRDGWLSPLGLSPEKLSDDPQVHTGGVRSSDRGFLHVTWKAYRRLLEWTASRRERVGGLTSQSIKDVPAGVLGTLGELGIDASMGSSMVWDWQRYFGKAACVGRPESMRQHAEQTGRRHHRGQAAVACCFSS